MCCWQSLISNTTAELIRIRIDMVVAKNFNTNNSGFLLSCASLQIECDPSSFDCSFCGKPPRHMETIQSIWEYHVNYIPFLVILKNNGKHQSEKHRMELDFTLFD